MILEKYVRDGGHRKIADFGVVGLLHLVRAGPEIFRPEFRPLKKRWATLQKLVLGHNMLFLVGLPHLLGLRTFLV